VRESEIEKKVVAWAKAHDILPLKLTPISDTGWPDHLWLFYYPAIAFIEFKAPGRKPGILQILRIQELQRRGYPVKVIDNAEEGIEFMEAEILSGNSCQTGNLPSVRGIPDVSGNG
jgi:hypothetical protein